MSSQHLPPPGCSCNPAPSGRPFLTAAASTCTPGRWDPPPRSARAQCARGTARRAHARACACACAFLTGSGASGGDPCFMLLLFGFVLVLCCDVRTCPLTEPSVCVLGCPTRRARGAAACACRGRENPTESWYVLPCRRPPRDCGHVAHRGEALIFSSANGNSNLFPRWLLMAPAEGPREPSSLLGPSPFLARQGTVRLCKGESGTSLPCSNLTHRSEGCPLGRDTRLLAAFSSSVYQKPESSQSLA